MFIPTQGVKLQEELDAPGLVEPQSHNHNPEDEIDQLLLDDDDSRGDAEKTGDSKSDGKATDESDADDEGGSADDQDDSDLDDARIPRRRLNAVIEERNTLREERNRDRERMAVLEDRLLRFEEAMQQGSHDQGIDYIDSLLNADDEQVIIDAINDEPRKFLGQLISRVRTDTAKELQQEGMQAQYQEQLVAGLDSFAKEHDGFKDYMYDTSVHDRIRRNPQHNVVSLYLTEEVIPALEQEYKETMEKAVAEAKKEARAQALKEVKAKRSATVLDGGSSSHADTSRVVGDEDMEAAGGDKRAAILARLKRRRDAST